LPILFEFNEPKSARLVRCAVLNDLNRASPESLRYKPLGQCLLSFAERDIPDEQSIQNAPPVEDIEYVTGFSASIVNSLRQL